ncbi:oxidoreductase [Fructilactobacillus lindneri]|uniref:Uncharacterized protein n=2 Tax=Fructilactobacillus lindneri TaxID=53444 RepID=A0A0R2JN12_9LACO|nr:Gfo/Idh/MocA family oxidoreductase [Fructilactobacillus lindneri]ANZ57970.1 oxidoreductase [Fructilactobacillus lindneri]ANZ59240.1 oxidoreductase [Fructilactobacillus lindneri]KRN78553.1 hypothetical protein IV52_GL000829 [Fructilactobacillus lindneri DSM 20690 = JCM 11027]POG98291.1 oxidoreductase [Fructilactobacillus lindneri]POH01592.1 oxidoreductase [Fructilactobacillus lindneri]
MIRLGTIGTNWITQRMVDAAVTTKQYKLAAVYSRHLETGKQFATKNHRQRTYTDLDDFFASDIFDTVYIASPNVFHYGQIMQALQHEKNVIVEKPMVLSTYQYQSVMDELDRHPQLHLFEAARNIHMPAFKAVLQAIDNLNHIDGGDFTFSQYSSRYDKVLAGMKPNVFNPQFGGGALADLGVYPVYAAVALFGLPKRQQYFPTFIQTGVDGKGTAVLNYEQFDVILNFSKISSSNHDSEIYSGKKTITIDNAGEFTSASVVSNDSDEKLSPFYQGNPMVPELTDFAEVLNHPSDEPSRKMYFQWMQQMQQVNLLMSRLAASAGIEYPNKTKE